MTITKAHDCKLSTSDGTEVIEIKPFTIEPHMSPMVLRISLTPGYARELIEWSGGRPLPECVELVVEEE